MKDTIRRATKLSAVVLCDDFSLHEHKAVPRIGSKQTLTVQNPSAYCHKPILLFVCKKSVLLGIAFLIVMVANAFSQSDALWTGQAQCQVTVQSQGFAHQEIQTWTITGPPIQEGTIEIYPATWSVTGQGGAQRAQGAQIMAAQWNNNVPAMSAPLRILISASDNRLIIKSWHAQL